MRSKYLGPTVLRTPDTIGAGRFALRLATSYFELDDSFGPIDHSVQFDGDPTIAGYGKLGTDVSAKMGLISLAASYGVQHDDVQSQSPTRDRNLGRCGNDSRVEPSVGARAVGIAPGEFQRSRLSRVANASENRAADRSKMFPLCTLLGR